MPSDTELILNYMHEHNETMCKGFDVMKARLDKTDDNIEKATRLQSDAAAIIKAQASTQSWFQKEMTAQRKNAEKVQWKLVGALAGTLTLITGALVFLVKIGFIG